jgi:predicted GTPase
MDGKEHLNILIAGRSGVGKSTLINALFGENFAQTAQGRPVTQTTKEITKSGFPVSIWDTRGLEMDDYKSTFDELERVISSRNLVETDPKHHIHVAWLCIHEDGRRVEPAETELHDMLYHYMPVIGVITKARRDDGFLNIVKGLLPKAKNIVRVRALAEEMDEGQQLEPMGLNELAQSTIDLIPEAIRRAFTEAKNNEGDSGKSRKGCFFYSCSGCGIAVAVCVLVASIAIFLVFYRC